MLGDQRRVTKMADIRYSADDALPAPPQQSQPLHDGLTNMPSAEPSPRPTSLDKEKSLGNDGSSSEKKSSEWDAPPAAQPAPQLSVGQGPPTPSPAEAAMQKNVNDVLISDVCPLPQCASVTNKTNREQIGVSTLLNRLKQSIASAKVRACVIVRLQGKSDRVFRNSPPS